MQHGVIFITQTIVQRQVRADSPLILGIEDVICLLEIAVRRNTAMQWIRSADIAEDLNLRGLVVDKSRHVRERICRPAKPVGIHPDRSDLNTEFETVVRLDEGKI